WGPAHGPSGIAPGVDSPRRGGSLQPVWARGRRYAPGRVLRAACRVPRAVRHRGDGPWRAPDAWHTSGGPSPPAIAAGTPATSPWLRAISRAPVSPPG